MNVTAQKQLLKKAYQNNVISVKELSKWLEYLEGNPVVQSATSDDGYLDFIHEVADRMQAKNEGYDKRKADRELDKILRGENITKN